MVPGISLLNVILTIVGYPFIEPGKTFLFLLVCAFIGMAIRDFLQSSNAIKRNFPLLGMARFIISSIGPELRQYLFANDREERPVPRYIREWIYKSSERKEATVPFGTQLDLDQPGTLLMRHSPLPTTIHDDDERILVGTNRPKPYEASLFNVSAMSFGSMSRNAILSLSNGARMAGCYHNTGEGGISPYHLEGGAHLTWQLGTAKFGARNRDGTFNEEMFREKAAHDHVKMIEIKLSQGAKPGKGGILPREKITQEIANIRLVEMGQDVISPPRHQEWDTAEGMCEFIGKIKELTDKPVGVKFCLGNPKFLDEVCSAIQSVGVGPDFMSVDGAEGGTGAAPLAHSNLLGYPMLDALMLTENKLIEYNLRDQIRICASGKIWTGGALAVALAAGADYAASARGFMLSIGCIQALHCNTNFCPTGVATQSKWLQRGLVPKVNGPRVANYHHAVLHEFHAVLGSCGHSKASDLSRNDLMKVTDWHNIRPMDELVPYPQNYTGHKTTTEIHSHDGGL
ncbi:MAG: FMN-binding glutamate synthase family protein [Myxococcota bacterium]|nr:FMN-binding glutamate synthase family protein [Myxococcota bacterium]